MANEKETTAKRAAVFVGIFVAVVAAVGVLRRQSVRPTAENSRSKDVLAQFRALDRRMDELNARVDDQSAQQVRALGAPETEPAPLPSTSPQAPAQLVSLQERERRSAALADAKTRLLDTAFAAEEADLAWSGAAVKKLEASYSAEEFSTLAVDTDCKATLCRVRFEYQGDEGAAAASRLTHVAPWDGQKFSLWNTETRKGFVYLAREGTELPKIDRDKLPL